MPDPDRTRTQRQLIPGYGLLVGAGIGMLLAALDVVEFPWGLIGGAAIGLVAGAAIFAMYGDRG